MISIKFHSWLIKKLHLNVGKLHLRNSETWLLWKHIWDMFYTYWCLVWWSTGKRMCSFRQIWCWRISSSDRPSERNLQQEVYKGEFDHQKICCCRINLPPITPSADKAWKRHLISPSKKSWSSTCNLMDLRRAFMRQKNWYWFTVWRKMNYLAFKTLILRFLVSWLRSIIWILPNQRLECLSHDEISLVKEFWWHLNSFFLHTWTISSSNSELIDLLWVSWRILI